MHSVSFSIPARISIFHIKALAFHSFCNFCCCCCHEMVVESGFVIHEHINEFIPKLFQLIACNAMYIICIAYRVRVRIFHFLSLICLHPSTTTSGI